MVPGNNRYFRGSVSRPPKMHDSSRLPVCDPLDFLHRKTGGMAYTRTHAGAWWSVAVTKGQASCGTALVSWLSQCTKFESWNKGQRSTASRLNKIKKLKN